MTQQATDLDAMLSGLPDLDRHRKVDGPPWDEAEAMAKKLLDAGPEAIAALLDQSPDEFDGSNHRPRYMFHLAASYACREGMGDQKRMLVDALAEALDGERSEGHKAFIIAELQHIATRDDAAAVRALDRMLESGSDRLVECAARALEAIGAPEPLVAAAGRLSGGQKRSVLNALVALRHAPAAPVLRRAMADDEADTRIIAGFALARLGDPASVGLLLNACRGEGWEGIQQARSALVLAERLAAAGRAADARRIYTHLRDKRTDEKDHYLRQAAERGLAALH